MRASQWRVLYRQFLFRVFDLDILARDARGGAHTLLGQLAALLFFCSILLALFGIVWSAGTHNPNVPVIAQLIGTWNMQHFLIATTMLVTGLFAVLSWDSLSLNRRDLLILGCLPIASRTLMRAKVAATVSALGIAVIALHCIAGFVWPLIFAGSDLGPTPALIFQPPLPPVTAADVKPVMDRDVTPLLRHLNLAAADGKGGIVLGVSVHGAHRILNYGAAHSDSLFEIGSITKTFTGLLLAQMVVNGKLSLQDPVNYVLPSFKVKPGTFEITLLDLATHYSGLPRMPDNTGPLDRAEAYTGYTDADLLAFLNDHTFAKPPDAEFNYSNVGFAILGAALSARAGVSYDRLLTTRIIDPLGMRDTTIALSKVQASRLLQGHDGLGNPTSHWDLQAFASAGGIRSSAEDMLRYLDAQLHPKTSPFAAAIETSHVVRHHVAGPMDIAVAWNYNNEDGFYEHYGGTGGFSAFALFNPGRDVAAVVAINTGPGPFPFISVLGEHVRERLLGLPALALAPVAVSPAGPVRSFLAYWITMVAAAVFVFAALFAIQGLVSYLMPRFAAAVQTIAVCVLVAGYCLQRSPVDVLLQEARGPWQAFIPSYWFVGLYQQLSGSLHPGLAAFAHRALIGLTIAVSAAVLVSSTSYMRGARRLLERPDVPPVRSRFRLRIPVPYSLEAGILFFSMRTLLRSRAHRLVVAFYAGLAAAFTLLFLNAPESIAGPNAGNAWAPLSVPLLASTILLTVLWITGVRTAFSLPYQLRSNWIFRLAPISAGPACLRVRRRTLMVLALAPPCLFASPLFLIWPWKLAALHVTGIVLLGILLCECNLETVQKLPFTCSYLPGKANLHITFWFCLYVILAGVIGAAIKEREALQSGTRTALMMAGLFVLAVIFLVRNHAAASDASTELRFEDMPRDKLTTLSL